MTLPLAAAHRDVDVAAGGRELDRVRDEVVDELGEPRAVADELGVLVADEP